MKFFIKKLLVIFTVGVLFTTSTTAVFAQEPNKGVTERPGYLSILDGTKAPGTKQKELWNVSSSGEYEFHGTCYNQYVYTNCRFYGKSSYTIHVWNSGEDTLYITAKTKNNTLASTQVAKGESTDLSVSGVNSNTKFYIRFGGSKFSGSIK